MKIKILLVEDDVNLGYMVSDQLKLDGYDVTLCANGAEGFKKFNEKEFDMCIFDVMMPKKDGFSLARDVRKLNDKIPILFLSAKSMHEDKVEGFNAGADDYLTKPFHLEEFQLRVKSLLKRVNLQKPEVSTKVLQIGKYIFDTENYILKANDFTKTLTNKEAKILSILAKQINQVVPRDVVLNAVWGQDDYFVGRSLDVFITKLRKYFQEDNSIQILNIHGVGFKLVFEQN
jgi:DNA-binding response OmpR family regulator